MTELIAMVATTPDGVIGRGGGMPWQLSSDLQRFKRVTMGSPLIMGRKTFDSIGRPLPGRRTLVLTRQRDWRGEGVEVFAEPDAMLQAIAGSPRAYVVGGAQVYQLLLPRCDTLLLTRVWSQVTGDTQLELPLDDFQCVYQQRLPQTERDSMPTEYEIRRRIQKNRGRPH